MPTLSTPSLAPQIVQAVKRAIAEAQYARKYAAWLAVMRAQGVVQ